MCGAANTVAKAFCVLGKVLAGRVSFSFLSVVVSIYGTNLGRNPRIPRYLRFVQVVFSFFASPKWHHGTSVRSYVLYWEVRRGVV